MTLRLKLIIVNSVIVLILFGISEWWIYSHTVALLEQHESILVETVDYNIALAKLQETRETMVSRVTIMRLLLLAATLLSVVAGVNYVWYKFITGPFRQLQAQINIMGRGTWDAPVVVDGSDEIAELATAVNQLGKELATTVKHINTSSQLSAFALVGNRLVRQINIARGQILSALETLRRAGRSGNSASDQVLVTLESANSSLASIERHFDTAFDRQLEKVTGQFQASGPPPVPESDPNARVRLAIDN
jgi:methyl-accepting chemotaxis protein